MDRELKKNLIGLALVSSGVLSLIVIFSMLAESVMLGMGLLATVSIFVGIAIGWD